MRSLIVLYKPIGNGCGKMKQQSNKRQIRTDMILLISFVLIGAVILAAVLMSSQGGAYVEIRVDGKLYGSYSLSQNQTVDINGIGGQNRLIIENGQAYMQEADCPDKLCVKQGNISMKGQSIICLPHKVVAEIVAYDGANENDSVDIIVK